MCVDPVLSGPERGRILLACAEAFGGKREAFARELGVSPGYLSKLIAGRERAASWDLLLHAARLSGDTSILPVVAAAIGAQDEAGALRGQIDAIREILGSG